MHTIHERIGSTSIIKNLYFTNPLFGQCRFFGNGNFKPNKFMIKRKQDKRKYKAIVKDPKQNKEKILDGTTIILMEPSDTWNLIEHYFHILEHLVTVWNAYKARNNKPVKRIILLSYEVPRWNWEGTNEINKYLLRTLFPESQILTFDHLKKMGRFKTLRFEKVISSDRAVANQEGNGKMLAASLPYINKAAIRDMTNTVHETIGTTIKPRTSRNFVLVVRTGERKMSAQVIRAIKQMAVHQGYNFRTIDFAQISYPQQLQIIRNTDVLCGIHGNALSHSLFLCSSAKVIEIFPLGSHMIEYRMLCDIAGIRYHGFDPREGEYSRKKSYELGEILGGETEVNCLPKGLTGCL